MAKGVMQIIRILVVDDFEPMRKCVCAALRERRELLVIGEASDGLEAAAATWGCGKRFRKPWN